MPVSITLHEIKTEFLYCVLEQRKTIEPSDVNLIALPIKLVMICLSLLGSPLTILWLSRDVSKMSSKSFSSAEKHMVLTTSSKSTSMLKSIFSNSILPTSTFEKSKISLIMLNNDVALFCAIVILRSCSLLSVPFNNNPSMPITPLMGVRIS